MNCRRTVAPFIAAFVLAGCSANVYRDETFAEASPYEARFATTPAATCEAARRTLLAQGYGIADLREDEIRGAKAFQPEEDEHTMLEITVVCMPVSGGAIAYANAVQTEYALKEKSDSAGLSISRIGSISLPWSTRKDSLVKVGAMTVEDPAFYRRLFTAMGRYAPAIRPER